VAGATDRTETVVFTGAGGDQIEGYLATAADTDAVGGVVVIHHMPGYDSSTKEITRRFAALGYNAICPNLHFREAPGASSDDAAAAVRAIGGVPDDRLVGDVDGAAAHLRSLPNANGRIAVIGYCSGGRQAFLAACSLTLEAAVDCYGGFVVEMPPEGFPLAIRRPLTDMAPRLSCPLLGLFGAEDSHPAPEHVAELDRVLTDAGKEHEFHTFENAGHGFFATDRPSYVAAAAEQGWALIEAFFNRHLATR
jgi:carboxymethylenebutenolidase